MCMQAYIPLWAEAIAYRAPSWLVSRGRLISACYSSNTSLHIRLAWICSTVTTRCARQRRESVLARTNNRLSRAFRQDLLILENQL
jgi:hypothetical protein